MKKILIIMIAAALQSVTAISNAQEDITSSLALAEDGHGLSACVSVNFGDFREVPVKALKSVWALSACVTQPLHLYHYVKDRNGKVESDSTGSDKKVWLPFYRLFVAHQGDSVVGIVYDNRVNNGIAGSHWLAGYGGSGWQDKGGKMVGLALLAWGASEAFVSSRGHHQDIAFEGQCKLVENEIQDDEDINEESSQSEPEQEIPTQLESPPDWGSWGLVGR